MRCSRCDCESVKVVTGRGRSGVVAHWLQLHRAAQRRRVNVGVVVLSIATPSCWTTPVLQVGRPADAASYDFAVLLRISNYIGGSSYLPERFFVYLLMFNLFYHGKVKCYYISKCCSFR